MEKTYSPQSIESRWYNTWEQQGYFKPNAQEQSYCIMIPPPNVTGSLHMGHGFQHTLMDALTRYHRMQGHNTLWQMGCDHAGIATQMVVERELAKQDVKRHDIGRDAFIDKVWQWKAHSGSRITQQLRRMGNSVDWDRERFTMDEGLSRAVNKVFIELYNEGLIYRGKRLVNWDPKFRTAISDLEVISEEEQGHMWHIKYPVVDSDEYVVIATTRPETLLGDSAVAVHPSDQRYQHLLGKHIALPLTDRQIPIIADEYADPEFGTGCVKITPAHDFNDYAVGLRHDLPLFNILTEDAHINQQAPEKYQGLERFEARQRIVDDIKALGLLVKVEEHRLSVPRGDRSGVVIEPYLTDQWYVKTAPLAEPALAAVKNGDIKFIPENWSKTYYQWMENIEDWCISRQLWWGHRIPAWYDAQGQVYVGDSEQQVREQHQLTNDTILTQDDDVLDTWFSSALWPFSTLGWPEQTPDLQQFYPTNVLVTGFDIIFFWVARMIMMGLKFTQQIPFKEIYITGLIRDHDGQKMSKSKGNVLDPIDLIDGIDLESLVSKRTASMMQPQKAAKIEKATRKQFPQGINAYGTDALRFTYCVLASTGRDIRFDIKRLEGYRNFCNKLWNASRYVLMNTQDHDTGFGDEEKTFSLADKWILSRLQDTISKAHHYFENYRFDLLAQTLYEFTWNEFCDWYLELSKPVLYDDEASAAAKRGARFTLVTVLENLLRLLHPLMPFITEEIWQQVKPLTNIHGDTIMLQAYPQVDDTMLNQQAVNELEWLQHIIQAIRNIRGEMNISPNKPVPLLLHQGNEQDRQWAHNNATYLSKLAKLESLSWLQDGDDVPVSATALHKDLEILIPMAGLIDVAAESARLNKELIKHSKDLQRCEAKLANPNYVNKAPADVVAKEQQKLAELKVSVEKLQQQINKLS